MTFDYVEESFEMSGNVKEKQRELFINTTDSWNLPSTILFIPQWNSQTSSFLVYPKFDS